MESVVAKLPLAPQTQTKFRGYKVYKWEKCYWRKHLLTLKLLCFQFLVFHGLLKMATCFIKFASKFLTVLLVLLKLLQAVLTAARYWIITFPFQLVICRMEINSNNLEVLFTF